MRCAHWWCEISAKMCLARQHIGRRGWQGDRYSFKSVPKDLYCMSDKCGQGLKVRQYMEDGDMEEIMKYVAEGQGQRSKGQGKPPATPNVAIATPDVAQAKPGPTPAPAASSNSTRTATDTIAELVKTCSTCGRALPLSAFSRKFDTPDGLERRCRECRSEANKKYKARRQSQPPCTIQASAPTVYVTRSMSDITPVPAPPSGTVLVDFSCCPSVLETLEAISREEFRTPAQQILYFLAKNLAAKEAMSGV